MVNSVEYAFVLGESGATLGERMLEGFADTASIPIDSRESFPDEKPKPRIRCHFAVGYPISRRIRHLRSNFRE